MSTKKRQLHKKSRSNGKKQRKTQKQQQGQQQFFIGGTCSACGACMGQNAITPVFRGGKDCILKRRRGGNDNPPSFDGKLPLRYFYSENTHNNDPTNPSALIPARQLPALKGGLKRTKKSYKKGGLGFSYFNGQMGSDMAFNPVNTVGDIATSQIGSLYLSGNIQSNALQNPSVFSQPVETKYNEYNRPLA